MIILQQGEICKDFEIYTGERRYLKVNAVNCLVDLTHEDEIYQNFTVDVRYKTIIKLDRECKLKCSFGCIVYASWDCTINARNGCHIIAPFPRCNISTKNNSTVLIDSSSTVKVGDNCIIRHDTYCEYNNNKYTLGNNNIIYVDKFDDILKCNFVKYGTGNIIIGKDGTRLNMDETFERVLRVCKG